MTILLRDQDQMSSTENLRHSPNRTLHEICSHEVVDIINAQKDINTTKEVDKGEQLKQNLEIIMKQADISPRTANRRTKKGKQQQESDNQQPPGVVLEGLP